MFKILLFIIFFSNYANSNFIEYDIPLISNIWNIKDTIKFILPGNISITGIIENIQYFQKENTFISGSVNPLPYTNTIGTFAASFHKTTMNANIHYSGNIQYELRPSNKNLLKNTYIMNQINMTENYYNKDKDVKSFFNYNIKKNLRIQNIELQESITLKILVLYTKETVISSGSEDSLLATIALAIGNFNLALQNSLVNIIVDYVAERIQEYDTYIELADMGSMLNQLGNDINIDRRYLLGCHAVHLVTKNTQYCGNCIENSM